LIWADLQKKKGLGASNQSYESPEAAAVIGITVLGDGIEKDCILPWMRQKINPCRSAKIRGRTSHEIAPPLTLA